MKKKELSVEKAKVAPPKPTFSPALLKSGMMAIKKYADIKWCPKHGINRNTGKRRNHSVSSTSTNAATY